MARRTFFSFHYKPDVQRASIVRNSWVTKERTDAGFFDAGLWESAKAKGDDSLKALMRDGVANTTVTCVLNGTETHARRWVRYEIVRGVLNRNGLLTVDIHLIPDWLKNTEPKGRNPLDYVGIYRAEGGIYFAEWVGSGWRRYEDYTKPIASGDLWFAPPNDNHVIQLSAHSAHYDYILNNGYSNLGTWIETAAKAAGRSGLTWI
jgi:hypothetical protein